MKETRKTAFNSIIKELEKLIEKQKKKVIKAEEKRKKPYVTHQGIKYYTENEIMEAYSCDYMTCATSDKLIEKLNNKKGNPDFPTDEEEILNVFKEIRDELLSEIYVAEKNEEAKKENEKRFQELLGQGMSYREAKTVLENEKLTEQM